MLTAIVPVSYADKLGLKTGIGAKGNRTSHQTGRPVKSVDKLWTAKLLKANQGWKDLPVSTSGKSASGGPAKSVAAFLAACYKLSDSQGYLTMSDLTKLSGLSSVNHGAGTKEVSEIIAKLCLADCIATTGRGRKTGEIDDETTFDIDGVEIDNIDELDIDDLV